MKMNKILSCEHLEIGDALICSGGNMNSHSIYAIVKKNDPLEKQILLKRFLKFGCIEMKDITLPYSDIQEYYAPLTIKDRFLIDPSCEAFSQKIISSQVKYSDNILFTISELDHIEAALLQYIDSDWYDRLLPEDKEKTQSGLEKIKVAKHNILHQNDVLIESNELEK